MTPDPNPLKLPPPPEIPITPLSRALKVERSTAPETWNWVWKDSLTRLLPFAAAGAAYAYLTGAGPSGLGLTAAGWSQDLLLGIAIGLPAAGIAGAFRARVAPGYRVPTLADQALQTTFYLFMNAPVEEVFWRGMVQTLAIGLLRRLPWPATVGTLVGWALTTAVFGAYHRLGGNWSWQSIAGVTVAGGLFGALYLASGSLTLPIVVHGCMTAGFLSWSDTARYALARKRMARGGSSASG